MSGSPSRDCLCDLGEARLVGLYSCRREFAAQLSIDFTAGHTRMGRGNLIRDAVCPFIGPIRGAAKCLRFRSHGLKCAFIERD
jgi:hypothetical protein